VSSTGIGSFTAFLKSVKPRGGDLVLLEIQPKVYEVFQLLGFSQFFNIKDNLEDSINYFRSGSATESVSLFPKVFACPICSKKLRALKPGRFRCSECKTILAIDNAGQVFLGGGSRTRGRRGLSGTSKSGCFERGGSCQKQKLNNTSSSLC
jgi:hypothetical protein